MKTKEGETTAITKSEKETIENHTLTIAGLRNDLYDTLIGVKAGTVKIETAKSIAALGHVIVNSAKVEIEYRKLMRQTNQPIEVFENTTEKKIKFDNTIKELEDKYSA